MAPILDIINILILVVVVLNSALGIFIYINKKETSNLYFFIFSLAATFWGISMFLFRSSGGTDLSVVYARILYVSAATIPFIFLFFIRVFPQDRYTIPKYVIWILGIPFLGIVYLSLDPHRLILHTYQPETGEQFIFFDVFYHTLYSLYIVGYFSLCYILLFIKYIKHSGIEKIQITYVILGTFVSTVVGVSTNLIMPYFGDFSLNWLGQIGIIGMVGSISYSILQHKLFDMKVIATQFIVFLLCTALFARLLFANGELDVIINGSFLAITIVVGIFLIRSVIQEVELRERIEGLAWDLEKANNQQSGLIHFISHEVKGFLTKSRNIFSLMSDGDYGDLPEYLKVPIQEGLSSDAKGVAMVQEILSASNLKKGTIQYKMENFDIKPTIESIVEDQKKNAEAKGLHMDVQIASGEYLIHGDVEQLNHTIKNLLDNSIKYTLEGSISVSLTQTANTILFTVKDTGVGIAPEDRPRLFTEGGNGINSRKVNVDSTGYGLYIAKKIVDSHSGRIWVESDGPGKGSTFFVELPIAVS